MSGSRGRIPQEILDEIVARTDIVDVVGRYVPLKKQGQNFTGLCPFHHEKTPSFSVSQNKQIFHCFGCGVGGNVFKFLMEIEHISFPEAARKLAEEVGVKIPEREQSESDRRAMEKRNRLLKWNEFAAFYYQAVLHAPQGRAYHAYLNKRQISDETKEKFQIGGCLEGWDGLYRYLKKKGAPDEDLIELGLVSPRNNARGCYDRFRDRLMFPIKDANGHVIAFGGRIIDAEKAPQKYINSVDSSIFHKGRNVYGLDLAKSAIRSMDCVIIVEGYMDVIACHQAGISNVVAPLGTALTEEQVKLLMRYSYNFITSFDGDNAGIRATLKSIDLIEKSGGKARVLLIPEGKDPDEYIKAYGIDAFQDILKQAVNGHAFRLAQAMKKYPGDSMDQKLSVLNEVLPNMAQIRQPAELDMVIRYTADRLFLSEQAIKNEIQAFRRSGGRRKSVAQYSEPDAENVPVAPKKIFPKSEVILLSGLILEPAFYENIEKKGGDQLFQSDLINVYQDFGRQYREKGRIDISNMDVSLSSVFAAATMQYPDAIPEGMTGQSLKDYLSRSIAELQYSVLNRKYRMLLNKIGSLEKGGQSDDMEQALMELEMIRQEKTQFEVKMRGDKQ